MSNSIISTVVATLSGQDHLTWLQSGMIIMGDGNKLYYHQESAFEETKDKGWQPIIIKGDSSMLKGITRLATNLANDKLAVVVAE
jgi:hypothetical protein